MDRITIKQWVALAGISLLTFTIFLDLTIVANALPTIQQELSASNTQTQWLLNLVPIALCALMALFGRVGDVYGLRKVFYINMFLMALFSIGCGLSDSIEMLIVFRALQGITLACITNSGALMPHNFQPHQRAKAMAIFAAVGGSGLALGPVIGGFIVELLNWRWVFYINFPIVLIGIAMCWYSVVENTHHDGTEKIDWVGAFFFVIFMVGLITTITEGGDWGWDSTWVISGFIATIISLIGFIITEMRVKQPLIPFPALMNRIFLPCALTCATCGAFIMTLLFFNPLYLQTILKLSPTLSGWLLLSTSLAYILMSPVAGFIDHKTGHKIGTLVVPGMLALAAIFHAQLRIHYQLPLILLAFIPFGIAWGFVNVSPAVAVMGTSHEKNAGAIIGALWTVFNVGAALGLAIFGLFFRQMQTTHFINDMTSSLGTLSSTQIGLIKAMVADPEHSDLIASHFVHDTTSHVLALFDASFVYAYNHIAVGLLGVSLFTFFFVAFVMKKSK